MKNAGMCSVVSTELKNTAICLVVLCSLASTGLKNSFQISSICTEL